MISRHTIQIAVANALAPQSVANICRLIEREIAVRAQANLPTDDEDRAEREVAAIRARIKGGEDPQKILSEWLLKTTGMAYVDQKVVQNIASGIYARAFLDGKAKAKGDA